MKIIQYIGPKKVQTDALYGTGLAWEGAGSFHPVIDKIAAVMVARHPDVYQDVSDIVSMDSVKEQYNEVEDEQPEEVETENAAKEAEAQLALDEIRLSIQSMSKKELSDFAILQFQGLKLDKRKKVNELRDEVLLNLDRFGMDVA